MDYFMCEPRTPDDVKALNVHLKDKGLQEIAAEGSLLGGADELKWCSYLDASYVQQLKERVNIDFLACNKIHFKVSDPVQLHVNLKNVSQVIAKVICCYPVACGLLISLGV